MRLDRIEIRGIVIHAYHGVREEEQRLGQRFAIDVSATLDTRPYAAADDYAQAVCYGRMHDIVREIATERRFNLIEALGDAIATRLLAEFAPVQEVTVEIRKPSAPIAGVFDHVAVVITRGAG